MFKVLSFLIVLFAFPTSAVAWTEVDAGSITELLSEKIVVYTDKSWNQFRASGNVVYKDSSGKFRGKWAVRGGRYCSKYGGNDWSCFSLQSRKSKTELRFIGDDGRIWVGKFYKPKS